MPTFALLLAISALSSDAQEDLAVQETHAESITLEWTWPREGTVRVRESSLKKGQRVDSTYVLSWDPDGEGTLLEYTDVRILRINGVDATGPQMRDALKPLERTASLIPRLKLNAAGDLIGFDGYEAMVDAVLGLTSRGADQERNERTRQIMLQPQVRQVVEAKTGGVWRAWVGNWIGLEVVRGAQENWKLDLAMTGGATPELELTFGERARHRGVDCVEITMLGVADEELLLRMFLEMMGGIAESADVELPEDFPIVRMASREQTRGIFATDGLRPIEVLTSNRIAMWAPGDSEPQTQLETRHYSFEWTDLEPDPEGKRLLR